jgi:DNA modification methylase
MTYQIITGDNRDILKTFPDNYFDSIVTDPPYGIDFLGKAWDANTGAVETYQECLRVLKPGGHILAFSAARTYHHLAVTLEQAGFEIRDQIMWIYSSGFPKSQDIGKSIQRSIGVTEKKILTKTTGYTNKENVKGKEKWMSPGNTTGDDYAKQQEQVVCTDPAAKQWEGWGTQLKPAHEPIALARKPLHKSNSIARNCQQWGVGALNIDAGRVAYTDPAEAAADAAWRAKWSKHNVAGPVFQDKDIAEVRKKQNKPSGGKGTTATHKNFSAENTDKEKTKFEPWEASQIGRFPSNVIGDIAEPYQKYFYSPKVSRRERHIGHETPPAMFGDKKGAYDDSGERYAVGLDARTGNVGNNHPTVKPVELMKYLISLITPAGGHVMDPFNGSGSTGMAAVELGYDYTGCELDPAYVEIAERRIAAWTKQDAIAASGLFDDSQ